MLINCWGVQFLFLMAKSPSRAHTSFLSSKPLGFSNAYLSERRGDLNDKLRHRNNTVLQHLGLAHHAARQQFVRCCGEFDDLVQEARLGLLLAMEKFDPDRGFRVSSYAMSRAKGQILHFKRDRQQSIRVPWRLRDLHARGMRLQEAQQHQGLPRLSSGELANVLRVSQERWQQAVDAHWQTRMISLDVPLSIDESQGLQGTESLLDQLSSPVKPEADQQLLWLKESMQTLEPHQQRWLDSHYIKGISLRHLALKEGIHEAFLRRAIKATVAQLRQKITTTTAKSVHSQKLQKRLPAELLQRSGAR